MSNENIRWNFLKDELWTLTFGAISRGSKLYRNDPTDGDKTKFKNTIKDYVSDLIPDYRNGVEGEEHMKNIKNLCEASKKHKDILQNGSLSIGRGQKILNLYLKYLWCLDEVDKPPHCPLDRNILENELGVDESWTKLDKLYKDEDKDGKSYEELIKKYKEKSEEEGYSIAKMELIDWNEKD